ncbi:tripartite tricarboxylate transporter substrate-binding protein [Xenophilus arseniciresistens]|uniref:Tripartite tricarboxylate transporter substrate-binding protein n=1 Tax=Xenophilus arseniciresistens TaxID=1283306 RepID=A0AAE3N829_9BURK|nr:tripartite tricarboxylate transporter substrate-binding protein [Xenophilus arseniciresistens]MDA7416613.1 tripartite tricarboxylate transporter substrate-binding protein [Xenophilus arseniciresistens]
MTAATLLQGATPAGAQTASWPSRMVRIVVPAAAGTGPDIMARMYGEHLSRSLGQPFVVENRPGASGNIGAESVARATDGHTLLYAYNQIPTMNPHLFGKLSYDMRKDMAPVSITLTTGYVLLANNQFPPNTLAEAIGHARGQPGKVAYASYGPGTASHLAFEIIQDQTRTQFLHVPYKQGQVTDVIAGQVAMVFEPFPSALPFAASRKVKALAVTTPKRLDALPDVPTLAEAVPGFDLLGWQGVWASSSVPPEGVARLQAEVARITRLLDMQKRIRDLASEPVGGTSQEMTRAIDAEYARWGAVIKAKNIRLD